jgi:hypothetical protein
VERRRLHCRLSALRASIRTERIARILLATPRKLRAPENIIARSEESLAAVFRPLNPRIRRECWRDEGGTGERHTLVHVRRSARRARTAVAFTASYALLAHPHAPNGWRALC